MTYNDLDIPNNVKVALDSIVGWATTGDITKGYKGYALTYVNALPSSAIDGQHMEGDEAKASKEVLKKYHVSLDKNGH